MGLGSFSYQLPLLGPEDAPSHYRARLHFLATHETSETVFDVKVRGMFVLKDIALDVATNKFKPKDVDIPSIAVTAHLIIEFVPKKGNPRINAIEVLRMD